MSPCLSPVTLGYSRPTQVGVSETSVLCRLSDLTETRDASKPLPSRVIYWGGASHPILGAGQVAERTSRSLVGRDAA